MPSLLHDIPPESFLLPILSQPFGAAAKKYFSPIFVTSCMLMYSSVISRYLVKPGGIGLAVIEGLKLVKTRRRIKHV